MVDKVRFSTLKGYKEVHLLDLINEFGEDGVRHLLNLFSCPLNRDLEKFLKNSAIEFAKQRRAQSFLVFGSYKQKLSLLGYYTIATKYITIETKMLSKSKQKKVLRVGELSHCGKRIILSSPLIAQLGKNYEKEVFPRLVSGDDLLKMACEKIQEMQYIGGGTTMYLECENIAKLTSFYERNGFFTFAYRDIDRDKKIDMQWNHLLVQMVKIS